MIALMSRYPQSLRGLWQLTLAACRADVVASLPLAQPAPTLVITQSNAGLQLQWQVTSLAPPPGLALFPNYQVEASSDLQSWQPRGPIHYPSQAAAETVVHALGVPTDSERYFRLALLVEFNGSNFINASSKPRAWTAGASSAHRSLMPISPALPWRTLNWKRPICALPT